MNKKRTIKKIVKIVKICFVLLLIFCFVPAAWGGMTDYSKSESWISFSANSSLYDVDCFYVYPTVIPSSADGKFNIPIEDEFHRIAGRTIFKYQASVFEKTCNMFAPYYRQACMSAFLLPKNEAEKYLDAAYQDIRAAFAHYLKNSNRPFILAGHSQGAMMLKKLLAEFMNPEELSKRLVAAYLFGIEVSPEYMSENPRLKFAEGADDTGVIISYNSRSPEILSEDMGGLLSVATFRDGITINPLNWKRDETYAPAELNLGAVFFHRRSDGEYDTEEIPHFADAQVNLENGVLIVKSVSSDDKHLGLPHFPRGIYHGAEISMFYRNLEKNARDRIEVYLKCR